MYILEIQQTKHDENQPVASKVSLYNYSFSFFLFFFTRGSYYLSVEIFCVQDGNMFCVCKYCGAYFRSSITSSLHGASLSPFSHTTSKSIKITQSEHPVVSFYLPFHFQGSKTQNYEKEKIKDTR